MTKKKPPQKLESHLEKSLKDMSMNDYYGKFMPMHLNKEIILDEDKNRIMNKEAKSYHTAKSRHIEERTSPAIKGIKTLDKTRRRLHRRHISDDDGNTNLAAPTLIIFLLLFGFLFVNNVYHLTDSSVFDVSESIHYINVRVDRIEWLFSKVTSITADAIKTNINMITGLVVGDDLPDLVILGMNANNSTSIAVTDFVGFNFSVQNIGLGPVDGTVLMGIGYGDGSSGYSHISLNLLPGESTLIGNLLGHYYEVGTYTATLTIDPFAELQESDNDNNIYSMQLNVSGRRAEVFDITDESPGIHEFNMTLEDSTSLTVVLECFYADCGNVSLYITQTDDSGTYDINISKTTPYMVFAENNPIVWEDVMEDEIANIPIYLLFTGNHNDNFLLSYRIESETSSWDAAYSYNITLKSPDLDPPKITLVSPINSSILANGTTSTVLSITTNESATCAYNTTPTFTLAGSTKLGSVDKITHSTALPGLEDNKNYNYYIRCNDSYHNENPSAFMLNFSINTSDSTPPAITFIDPVNNTELENGTTEYKIRVSVDKEAACYISNGIVSQGTSGSPMYKESSYIHYYDMAGLQDNKYYTRFISCKDNNNNWNMNHYLNFSISERDTTKPVIDDVIDDNLNRGKYETYVSVTLETDEPAKCNYGTTDNAFNDMENITVSYSTLHTIYDIYSENTSVKYYVRCIDSANNMNTESRKIDVEVTLDPEKYDEYNQFDEVLGYTSKLWNYIWKDETINYDPGIQNIPISNIKFTVSSQLSHPDILIRSFYRKPSSVSTPNRALYRFVGILTERLSNTDDIEIKFDIPKSFVQDNISNASSIDILKYSDGGWYELPVSVSGDTTDILSYTANVSELDGYYVIAYDEGCVPAWDCTQWGLCFEGKQSSTCEDLLECNPSNTTYERVKSCDGSDDNSTDTNQTPVEESCDDGIKNQDEVDVDCGGICDICIEESCDDGIKNQDEVDVDCGGTCGACIEESCDDGIKNQDEEDIDCGGVCDECEDEADPFAERPVIIEEKTFPLKWIIISIILVMLAGLSVVGIRYYQDHESPKEIEEPLLNYISTGLYNHLDPIRIKDALLNQGWDPALVDQYVDIIGFILSNIELDPNIDNIIDQLFSSGWNMQLAKGFVHEVSIRFFQLEIQRHRGIPISTMYNMLIDDGYPKDLVDQAFARINR